VILRLDSKWGPRHTFAVGLFHAVLNQLNGTDSGFEEPHPFNVAAQQLRSHNTGTLTAPGNQEHF
jgi:hypothetical protein